MNEFEEGRRQAQERYNKLWESFWDISKRDGWVNALREHFPSEWQVVTFQNFQPYKDMVEFATYVRVDGVDLRHDSEFSTEQLEEIGWGGAFGVIRTAMDIDIEAGIVEEVRVRNDEV